MNIFVPYSWLKEHLETKVNPEEMQKLLSLSGPSVERIHHIQGEPVLEIEVTTNRMDSASIRGIAREAAVILSHAGEKAQLKEVPSYAFSPGEITHSTQNFPIHIQNDPKLCSRVMGVILTVKTRKSQPQMSTRLEQIGSRSLNNLIDITNYVMTEIGHPVHVFDADRLGSTMIVRESKKGEKLITLDEKTHTLQGGDIVVDNGKGELTDLIGIMGTANSVVTDETTRILLFIEHSDPKRIRKTSMGLAIRTTAAQLNEKMLDPNLVEVALMRAIHLLQEHADAQIESQILDLYEDPPQSQTLSLPLEKVQAYLGVEIPIEKQVDILVQLGCEVKQGDNTLTVTTPTFRPDLEIPADLIEEIARIYGYHNLPSRLMPTAIPTEYPKDTDFSLEHAVKEFLATLGWQEIYTYSAVSEVLAEQSGFSKEQHLKLQNPLNEEHLYMRRSLVPSHEEIIDHNRHLKNLSLFELANTYDPQKNDLPDEKLCLTLVSTLDYRTVRGHLELLLEKLHVSLDALEVVSQENLESSLYSQSAKIQVEGKVIGVIGILRSGHVAVDLEWKKVLEVARPNPTYRPLSLYSPVIEDMTFTIPEHVAVGTVLKSVKGVDASVLHVEIKDVYNQNITFTVQFHRDDKQLTGEDTKKVREKIVEKLTADHRLTLVGEV